MWPGVVIRSVLGDGGLGCVGCVGSVHVVFFVLRFS